MRVAIRVDASREMGIGHLRRCLALADALAALEADVRFVVRDLGLDLRADLAGRQVHILPMPATPTASITSSIAHAHWAKVTEAEDGDETAAVLVDRAPDWILVDSYAFGADWHRRVRAATGARIVAIDDLADRAMSADLIVDHNVAVDEAAKYRAVAPDTPVLIGPRFALLGRAYATAPRHAFRDAVESIGIFMGGVDAVDATGTTLDALAPWSERIEVATTSANPHLPALRARGVRLVVDQPDLTGFFARHDLQIGAGGGANWERCRLGAPTLLLVVADNQRAGVPALVSLGAAATCAFTRDAIRSATAMLIAAPGQRRSMAERAQALVDGRGASRVALRMGRDRLTVRRAVAGDAAMLFAWRNHPATRSVSRDTQDIVWSEHLAWFGRAIDDPDRVLLIGTVGPMPVGMIRFDHMDDRSCEVSLYLDPALHGLGLGQRMLRVGEGEVTGLDIHAEVKDGNSASSGMFARAGYDPCGRNHWIKPATRARTQGISQ